MEKGQKTIHICNEMVNDEMGMSDKDIILAAASRILEEHMAAFLELAK